MGRVTSFALMQALLKCQYMPTKGRLTPLPPAIQEAIIWKVALLRLRSEPKF